MIRDDRGLDVLMGRLRMEDPAARAVRRARERETTYGRAWAAARRQGLEADPVIGRFILERLYPDLPTDVAARFEARLREDATAGRPGIRRPAPSASDAVSAG